jgi:hypothetical protein
MSPNWFLRNILDHGPSSKVGLSVLTIHEDAQLIGWLKFSQIHNSIMFLNVELKLLRYSY